MKKINGIEYQEIKFYCGQELEECFYILKLEACKNNIQTCGEFNKKLLTSNMTIDEAFKLVTGLTKYKFDKKQDKEIKKYNEQKVKHKKQIPKLTKEYIEKGHKELAVKYWNKWDKCVPIRLSDLYQGMELNCTLEIIKLLNKNINFNVIKTTLEKQGHSGMSYSLVCSMIESFHDKGKEFIEYIK